jgi:transposase
MRFYNVQHSFYCGVDLHARSMFIHILNQQGETVFAKDLPATPEMFRDAIRPFREGLVVGCECMFAWYWLADVCEDASIPFALGHALYMRAIHGGKAKNDRIDAAKIAGMLRGGMFPMAYVYPRAMRDTRDLLRRRTFFVRQKAQLIAHIQNTNSQYNLPAFDVKLSGKSDYSDIIKRFAHESTRLSIGADAALIDQYQQTIAELEKHLVQNAKVHDGTTYYLLQSTPGIGKVLGLIMLYEIQDIKRFPQDGNFLSYSRLVRCEHESGGKKKGSGGHKIGNAHLKWAFSEAACLMKRSCSPVKTWLQRQEKKRGKRKAMAILEAKIGRAVYQIWSKQQPFDAKKERAMLAPEP